MNIIELNHIDLNSIGLNSKVIEGVGKSHGGKVKPYIAGHVTDGSSTVTFTVNGNESVTVPVDANGNWKWVADRKVTSFENAFYSKNVIDTILLYGFKDFTTTKWMFNSHQNYDSDVLEYVEFRNCDFSKTTDETRMFRGQKGLKSIVGLDSTKHSSNETLNTTFQNCNELEFEQNFNWQNLICASCTNFTGTFMGCKKIVNVDVSKAISPTTIFYMINSCPLLESIKMPKILSDTNVDGWAAGSNKLKNVTAEYIANSMMFVNSAVLTQQSVVNIFNAVAADGITLTFYATVYAMIEEQLEIEGSPIYEAYWNSDYDFNYASA